MLTDRLTGLHGGKETREYLSPTFQIDAFVIGSNNNTMHDHDLPMNGG